MIGLEPTNEPGNPFNGIIPVTPVMDTQLDDIFLRDLLIPLTKRLLQGLKDKIDEQRRENWLEIYLTVFIIMSNMGWVMKGLLPWASRYGLKVKLNFSSILPQLLPFRISVESCMLTLQLEARSKGGYTHPRLHPHLQNHASTLSFCL
jgi:hypothetical protein